MATEKIYKPREFAKIVNVSVQTLQSWDKQGKLAAKRNISDRRYYTEAQVKEVLGE